MRTKGLCDDAPVDCMHPLLTPYEDAAAHLLAAAESILAGARRRPASAARLLLATLGAWFLYVPVHELLHAFGCVATGGRVTTLQIAPVYGGRLLESALPFVRAGGGHAGRLSGFDTGGSDLVYLATDLAPYLPSLLGFVVLRAARRRRSALLFGTGAVLLAAPLMGILGDYFEMAGVLVSDALILLRAVADDAGVRALRSDDLPAFLAGFPSTYPANRIPWALAAGATFVVDLLLVTATLAVARLRRADAAAGTAADAGD